MAGNSNFVLSINLKSGGIEEFFLNVATLLVKIFPWRIFVETKSVECYCCQFNSISSGYEGFRENVKRALESVPRLLRLNSVKVICPGGEMAVLLFK